MRAGLILTLIVQAQDQHSQLTAIPNKSPHCLGISEFCSMK